MVIFHSYVSLPEGILNFYKFLTYNNLLYPKKTMFVRRSPFQMFHWSKYWGCSIDLWEFNGEMTNHPMASHCMHCTASRDPQCSATNGTLSARRLKEVLRLSSSAHGKNFTQLGDFGWLGHQFLKETGDSWGYYITVIIPGRFTIKHIGNQQHIAKTNHGHSDYP